MAGMSPQAHRKLKTAVWAGSVFAITVAGTLYGAGLRTQGQINKKLKEQQNENHVDRLQQLETRQRELQLKRELLEKKLEAAQRKYREMTGSRGSADTDN